MKTDENFEFPYACKSTKVADLKGQITIPGDKSISHRSLMFGGIAEGETIINGLLASEDVYCTAAALTEAGAKIHQEGSQWRVIGVGKKGLKSPDKVLDMGNSGTSTRLLLGLFAGYNVSAIFSGDASLTKRPMKRVTGPLSEMGATFISRDETYLPIAVQSSGDLKAIEYEMPIASAQVKSAILLAGLNAKGKTKVIEPAPTRDYTETMLRQFGVEVNVEGNVITIEGGQALTGCAIDVPADPSSAAFPIVAALITPGSDIVLPNIGLNKRRAGLYETLIEMGANIEFKNERNDGGEPVADLHVKYSQLKGITVPSERVPSMIDEFPILSVAASCAEGDTRMSGLEELRVKESDRLGVMARGLAACGVDLDEGKDSLIIRGNGNPPKGGALIETHLDHRIAMSFLVLGCVTEAPVTIDDMRPIQTSFPDFIPVMDRLGANFSLTGDKQIDFDDELEMSDNLEIDLSDEIIKHLT